MPTSDDPSSTSDTIPLKVLAVATNAAPTINGKKSGLFLSELTHFTDVLADAGIDVDIASPAGGRIPLDELSNTDRQRAKPENRRFLEQPDMIAALADSPSCADVELDRYAAVYLAGGHGTMWDFRQSDALRSVIAAFHGAGRYVTAVCHGVSGLVDVTLPSGEPLVAGRRVTGFTNLEDRLGRSRSSMPYLLEDALKEQGAIFGRNTLPFTSRVETDKRLLTGQNPQSARALAETLVQRLRAAPASPADAAQPAGQAGAEPADAAPATDVVKPAAPGESTDAEEPTDSADSGRSTARPDPGSRR